MRDPNCAQPAQQSPRRAGWRFRTPDCRRIAHRAAGHLRGWAPGSLAATRSTDADAIILRLCSDARRQALDVAHALAELAEVERAVPALRERARARLTELSRTHTRTLRTIANMPATSARAIEAKARTTRARSCACAREVA